MIDSDEPNVRAAVFGRIVEDFFSTPVGAHIRDKALMDRENGLEELKDADASNADLIRSLQLKVRVADTILTWLQEAIMVGHSAFDQLREEENDG